MVSRPLPGRRDFCPDYGVSQPGKDRQVNVKLHPVKMADPQREHGPLVLQDPVLRSTAPRW